MTHHDRCTLIGGCGGGIVVAVELDDWTIDFGSFCFQVATTAWHASQGLCTFNIFTSAIELHFEQKLFPPLSFKIRQWLQDWSELVQSFLDVHCSPVSSSMTPCRLHQKDVLFSNFIEK